MSTSAITPPPALGSNEPRPAARGLRPSRLLLGWLLVFGLIALWDRDVLTSPPYEDQAVGWWLEADFLADSHFDYWALFFEQEHYMSSPEGVRSYMISLLPSLLALLMLVSPSVEATILVVHLAICGVAAGIVVLMYGFLRPRFGLAVAVAVPLAMFTTPLFHTQVLLAGMDVPLTLLALVAALAAWQGRWRLSVLAAGLAFLMKATGGLVVLASLTFLLLRLVLAGSRLSDEERRTLWRAARWHTMLLVAETLIVVIGDTSAKIRWNGEWPNVITLPYAIYWCPEVMLLSGLATLLVGISLLRLLLASSSAIDGGSPLERLGRYVDGHRELVYAMIFVWGMLAASGLYFFIPRYFSAAMPPLFLALALLTASRPAWRPAAASGFALLSLLNLANAEGRFYPPIDQAAAPLFEHTSSIHARSCPFTERSREYLQDHESNQAAIRLIEEQYASHPILAARPLVHFLREPRLGYVRRRLEVVNVDQFPTAVEAVAAIATSPSVADPICVRSAVGRIHLPEPTAEDDLLYDDGLTPRLVVFRLRIPPAARANRQAAQDWYLERTWPGPWLAERLQSRVDYLAQTGRLERAITEAEYVSTRSDDRLRVAEIVNTLRRRHAELAKLHLDARFDLPRRAAPASAETTHNREVPAFLASIDRRLIEHLGFLRRRRSLAVSDRRPPAVEAPATGQGPAIGLYSQAVDLLLVGEWEGAVETFQDALKKGLPARQATLAHLTCGVAYLDRLQITTAQEQFAKALELDPAMVECLYYLGIVRLTQGQARQAADDFRHALQHAPEYAAAQEQLLIALVRESRWDEALQIARRIAQHEPPSRLAQRRVDRIERMAGLQDSTAPASHIEPGALDAKEGGAARHWPRRVEIRSSGQSAAAPQPPPRPRSPRNKNREPAS